MSNSIKLSPKHGVNPTIPICFWCGKEKNEVALMGKINKEDSEAPRRVITNYEPCDSCKELFAKGIHIIGVSETPVMEGMFPISKSGGQDLFPTGAMFVAREEWVKQMVSEPEEKELLENVLAERVMLMPSQIVEDIVHEAAKAEEIPCILDEEEGENSDENN